MQTQYNEIINSFVDKYGLTRGQVVAEIEKTFSLMLTRWHRANTVVLFGDNHLQALRYEELSSVPLQKQFDLVTMRGWNTIRRIIDKNLTHAACLHDVGHYKRKEHEMRWGEIIRKHEDGFLVEIEIVEGEPVIAECPLNRIGIHERADFSVGQRRAFHLRRVEPILLNGVGRVRIVVDRVSKNLVTTLLQEKLGRIGSTHIFCSKRYVGHKSFVEADEFLPKEVIKAASRELHEHIQVTVMKKAGDRKI